MLGRYDMVCLTCRKTWQTQKRQKGDVPPRCHNCGETSPQKLIPVQFPPENLVRKSRDQT